MSRLRLSKLHGTGNDFLVLVDVDDRWGAALDARTRSLLCDRHFGVGADGLVRIRAGSGGADLTMELTNADGAPAEMSGNGARCLAAVAVREGVAPGPAFTLATGGGVRTVEYAETPESAYARVDMGRATFEPAAIPVDVESPFGLTATVDGMSYEGDAAGMGNPHLVLFVDDPDAVPVERHGPVLEHDERFPRRTNVEFVASTPEGLRMRVWERGVGQTLSCGTGACAAAAAARRRGLVGDSTAVDVPGGRLGVELGDTVWLGGPVAHLFDVEVDLDVLARAAPRGVAPVAGERA